MKVSHRIASEIKPEIVSVISHRSIHLANQERLRVERLHSLENDVANLIPISSIPSKRDRCGILF